MKRKMPLLNALLEYSKEDNTIFSMPGNKCGKAFYRDEIGRKFIKNMGKLDITEVEPLDNLHKPQGVIKEAQEHLANLYNVKKAFFMVNGSSGGNLTAIFSAFKEGDEVLVERNCHKSIYNALVLRKLKVVYIEPWICERGGLFLPPNKENIYESLKRCKNPKGIILTYPNYYGISYNIYDVLKNLKRKGLKVIIDEAHGAHYGITDKLPINMASIADYTVLSAHKTLPALTGGAYLLVNDDNEDVELYISLFMTTSPSYLIMASLDYSRYYLESYGKFDYEDLIEKANEKKKEINNMNKVQILIDEDVPEGYVLDNTRYIMILKNGYSGHKLLKYLKSYKIQAEMSFQTGVVLILSPSNWDEGIKRLIDAIEKLDIQTLRDKETSINININKSIKIPKKALEPYEAFELSGEYCKILESEGKIIKEDIIPYPPGIPIISSGEIMEREIIERVLELKNSGVTIIGISDDKVKVIKHKPSIPNLL